MLHVAGWRVLGVYAESMADAERIAASTWRVRRVTVNARYFKTVFNLDHHQRRVHYIGAFAGRA